MHKRIGINQPLTIAQNGFIYIWVSNESENTKVWFDDLKITHTSSLVTQATDFGVWGDVLREQKSDESKYRFGYQGQFAEKDEETGWNHFELREYDPIIGRWLVPDPMNEFWSPYLAMGNNPVNAVDPSGGCTGDCDYDPASDPAFHGDEMTFIGNHMTPGEVVMYDFVQDIQAWSANLNWWHPSADAEGNVLYSSERNGDGMMSSRKGTNTGALLDITSIFITLGKGGDPKSFTKGSPPPPRINGWSVLRRVVETGKDLNDANNKPKVLQEGATKAGIINNSEKASGAINSKMRTLNIQSGRGYGQWAQDSSYLIIKTVNYNVKGAGRETSDTLKLDH